VAVVGGIVQWVGIREGEAILYIRGVLVEVAGETNAEPSAIINMTDCKKMS
jgi:hypothetical protein